MSTQNFESYPPLFRQPHNQIQQSPIPIQISNSYSDIPILDLHCLNPQKLNDACKNWGIFRVINHGIPIFLLSELHKKSKKLFDIPFESKQALFAKPLSYFWGTPALNSSGSALKQRDTTQNVNWVEGFNIPMNQICNVQPPQPQSLIDNFRNLQEEYGRHLYRIARTIFAAMEENLDLDLNKSESHLSESTGIMRVYRYPRCVDSNDHSRWGLDVHTDSSILSILSQEDNVGGFEFFKDNKWFNVNPIPNTLVVNLGDLMQVISDDEYVAVKHRVKVNREMERSSICYFVFPDESCVIQSRKYKPFTNVDFRAQVQEDVKTLGFKVGLERFKRDSYN